MAPDTLQLMKKVFITGTLRLKTGLHIGGSSLGLTIGGVDKVVVRNPVNNCPYIPGSSLKGKLRSLLEKSHGLVTLHEDEDKGWEGRLCTNPEEPLVRLFGVPADTVTKSKLQGKPVVCFAPTRLTVRDGELSNIDEIEQSGNTDMYGTEVKTEVSIDRLTSAANPRNFERVPAGAKFPFEMVVDIYNVDNAENAKKYMELLAEGFRLLKDDYLGGQGSRGYGQVEILQLTVKERTADDYRNLKEAKTTAEYDQLFTGVVKSNGAEV